MGARRQSSREFGFTAKPTEGAAQVHQGFVGSSPATVNVAVPSVSTVALAGCVVTTGAPLATGGDVFASEPRPPQGRQGRRKKARQSHAVGQHVCTFG
jgi:hypothetical protein